MKTSESKYIYRNAWESSTRMQIAHISHHSDAPTHTLDASANDSRPPNDAVWNSFLWVFILVSTHRHDDYYYYYFFQLYNLAYDTMPCIEPVSSLRHNSRRHRTNVFRISFSILAHAMWRMKLISKANTSKGTPNFSSKIIRCCFFHSVQREKNDRPQTV